LYGYGLNAIQEELALMHYLLVAFPVVIGVITLAVGHWSRLVRLLNYLAECSRRCEPDFSVSCLLGLFLLVPIALVWLLSFLHIPFMQTRNLLILTPALSLVVASGLGHVLRLKRLRCLAGVALVCLAIGLGQYDHVAGLYGAAGYQLNIASEPWRELAQDLTLCDRQDLPVLTTNTSSTDPILFYLAGQVQRLDFENHSVEDELPSRFLFVDVDTDRYCRQTRERLRQRAQVMEEMLRLEGLVVYDVVLEPDSKYP
jgi:hypothetical protein